MARRGLLALLVVGGCDFPAQGAPIDGPAIDTPPDMPPDMPPDPNKRIKDGLIAFWTFDDNTGTTVRETSHTFNPSLSPDLDLTINGGTVDPNKFAWSTGFLEVKSKVTVANMLAQNRLNARIKATNAVTLEVWVLTPTIPQNGTTNGQPARIVTLANDNGGSRNIGIGLDGDKWVAQMRTVNLPMPGIPQGDPRLVGPVASPIVTHLVVTGSATERAFYVDGVRVASDTMAGGFVNWDNNYKIGFAGDPNSANAWSGELFLAAIYDRVLTDAEIMQNKMVGPDATP